jgi:hypothetical protein
MATKLTPNVDLMIETLKQNSSARFSKADFQGLVYAILADKDFKTKKYVLKNAELVEEDVSINEAMRKFMDKLLKHAGMSDSNERANVIDTFDFGSRDVEWISDAVDEAMYQYIECGKNMRIFRDKMVMLAFKKFQRSGKYEGKLTFRKSVVDRQAVLLKKQKKAD